MSKLIFFVDDDKMMINLMEYTFQSRKQYEVQSFYSGEKCIDAMNSNPDLIVLDHQLASLGESKMDGIETLEKVREMNNDVPVVILTAHGSDELSEEFISRGAERFLTKDDFFIDSLIHTIEEILD